MVARTFCRYLPRWHSEFCQIPLRIPVTNKRCAVSFRARLRTPPRLFRFGSIQEPRERPSTAAPAAGRITCLDLSSRATVGAAEVNPESLTAYCL